MIDVFSPRGGIFSLTLCGALILGSAAGCEKLEVTTVTVDRGPVESTVTSVEAGVVEPWAKASLAAPVSGRIVRVHGKEGNHVKEGDPLVELENDLERLRLEETGKELARLRKIEGHLVTEEQLERAEFAYQRARVDHERTFVRAPFSGTVADLNARVGEMTFGSMALAMGSARGGADPLVYLVDDSRLYVKAEVDETDVFRVHVGQTVKVTLGGNDRVTLRARVIEISPAVSTEENESRTAEVHAELELPAPPTESPAAGAGTQEPRTSGQEGRAQRILVGMSADLEILVDRKEDALRLPATAILERGDEKYVFVVRSGKLHRQTVSVGLGNWDMSEITSGLEAGEQVVLPTDLGLLSEGREVRTAAAATPAASR